MRRIAELIPPGQRGYYAEDPAIYGADALYPQAPVRLAEVGQIRSQRVALVEFYPVQANAVFAVLPPEVTARLQKRFRFYTWDAHTGEVRWMCAFDTTVSDVDTFSAAIAEEMGS